MRIVTHCNKCGTGFEGEGETKEKALEDAKGYMKGSHESLECLTAKLLSLRVLHAKVGPAKW